MICTIPLFYIYFWTHRLSNSYLILFLVTFKRWCVCVAYVCAGMVRECVCVCSYTCARINARMSEDKLSTSVFSVHCVSYRVLTQISHPGDKHLYLLSHFIDPICLTLSLLISHFIWHNRRYHVMQKADEQEGHADLWYSPYSHNYSFNWKERDRQADRDRGRKRQKKTERQREEKNNQ